MSYVVPSFLAVAIGVLAVVRSRSFTSDVDAPPLEDCKRLMGVLGVLIVAWWLVPGGLFVAGGALAALSVVSPAGRQDWSWAWKGRVSFVAFVVASMMLGGLLPVVAPTQVEGFGSPLGIDNPGGWPRSSEDVHVVVTGDEALDVAVVAVRSMHVPWQGGASGMAGGALLIADLSGQAKRELERTVLLLDDAGGPRLDEGLIALQEVDSGGTHTFRLDGDRTELAARRWTVYSELGGFGARPVAEVVVVAAPTNTGVLELLTIVRPAGHPDAVSDPFAEGLVETWWSARNAKV
jgi:hypothetical protein